MTVVDSKIAWEGEVVSVQPRIRLMRSFDQRSHSYLGYVLRIRGTLAGEAREFVVALGQGAHEKYQFRVGDRLLGAGERVADSRLETADIYKASGFKIISKATEEVPSPPPFLGTAAALDVYRERGHRRLAATTYRTKCTACKWGCEMGVEMIVDQWNPSLVRYRRETFCYEPKSCSLYKPGPTRKVPGRKGMSWEEEDWVDEDATSHRGPDD